MKIRKAKKEDFNDYLQLIRFEEKEHKKGSQKRPIIPKDRLIKKAFNEALKSKKHLILFVEESKKIIGYLHATYFKGLYYRGGYIEQIFIVKEFRSKGFGKKLIDKFIQILKEKGYNRIHLSVNIKNPKAQKLYKRLGFQIHHYELKKEWK